MSITLTTTQPPVSGGQGGPGGGTGDPMETLYVEYAQMFPADGSVSGDQYRALLSEVVKLEQVENDQAREILERAEELYANLEGVTTRAFYQAGFRDAVRLLNEVSRGRP